MTDVLLRGARDGRGDRAEFAPEHVRFVRELTSALPGETERLKSAQVIAKAIVEGQQAKAVVRAMGLGSGKMASSIVSGIQDAVAKAMTDARAQIGSATDELVAEIKSGAANVKRAIQVETANVRQEFGQIVGNAAAAAEEAVNEAKDAAAAATGG